jgi:hypothetical protein
VPIIHLPAVLPTGPPTSLGSGVGEVPRRIAAKLGNPVEGVLPRPLSGVVVAEGPSELHVGPGDDAGDQCEDGPEPGGDARPCGCARHGGLACAPAALGMPRAPRWGGGVLRLSGGVGRAGSFLRDAAHDRLDASRKGAPCVDTHERDGQEDEAGDRLPLEPGEEPIQPLGMLVRLGHHHIVASEQVDRS